MSTRRKIVEAYVEHLREWRQIGQSPESIIDDARRTLGELHRVHDERFPVSLCHTCRPLVLALDMWDA